VPDTRKTILDETVPAKQPWGGIVRRGQRLRIIDCKGRQAVDFLCYNADDKEERYSAPNTIKAAGTISLTSGHTLYSDLARPLFKIVDDSYGSHDTIGGCCSAPSNLMLYGVDHCPGCRENSLPGRDVELESAMDTIVAISNCPQINNPANDFNPTPIRLVISQ
jgi:uncharacterized protein YcgI (DUF1989 family)